MFICIFPSFLFSPVVPVPLKFLCGGRWWWGLFFFLSLNPTGRTLSPSPKTGNRRKFSRVNRKNSKHTHTHTNTCRESQKNFFPKKSYQLYNSSADYTLCVLCAPYRIHLAINLEIEPTDVIAICLIPFLKFTKVSKKNSTALKVVTISLSLF